VRTVDISTTVRATSKGAVAGRARGCTEGRRGKVRFSSQGMCRREEGQSAPIEPGAISKGGEAQAPARPRCSIGGRRRSLQLSQRRPLRCASDACRCA
jgi:hypothetical protein